MKTQTSNLKLNFFFLVSISDYSKNEVPVSIVEPPALPPYTRNNKAPSVSVIGRLLLTPMGNPNHFILPNAGQQSAPPPALPPPPPEKPPHSVRLESTAEEGSVDGSPVLSSTSGSFSMAPDPPSAHMSLRSEKDDSKKEVFVWLRSSLTLDLLHCYLNKTGTFKKRK